MTRTFDGHRIPFALDGNQVPRSVDEVTRGLACNCHCPQCDEPLIAKKGERRLQVWHFSHAKNSACSGALASSLHLAVKELIDQHKKLLIPPCLVFKTPSGKFNLRMGIGEYLHEGYKYTDNAAWHDDWLSKGAGKGISPSQPQMILFDSVQVEQTEGNVRPDIVGIAKGKKLYIEVAVTHLIDKEKLERLRKRGTPTIELVVPFAHTEEVNWENLKHWLFSETIGKYWVLNFRVEKLADEDAARRKTILENERAEERKRELQEQERKKARQLERERELEETAAIERKKAEEKAKQDALRAEEIARRKEADRIERLARDQLQAFADDIEWEAEQERKRQSLIAQMEAQAKRDRAIQALAGNPSPNFDPNGCPVIFLDYDSVIMPGSSLENRRLELLAGAIRGKVCSIVITSRIRQLMTPDELAVRLSPLGGRHIGVTPVIDENDSYGTRGDEILAWLGQHDVPEICIIDGSRSGLPIEPLWVSTRFGFTQDHVNQIRFWNWQRRRMRRELG